MSTIIPRQTVLLAIAACSILSLASCASGPTYSEVKAKLPPIEKNHGRVFVYRPQPFAAAGAALRPAVKIDGQTVGTSESGGFLYSDQNPGKRTVSLSTEVTREAVVDVLPGKASFVECSMEMGLLVGRIKPVQVAPNAGESNIQSCKLSSK